jgi:DNA-binding NtrC family response regulator
MTKTQSDDDPFENGDLFLQHFLPGSSPTLRALRGLIYRLNIMHRNKRMVPSILINGEPGVGKGFTASAIAAHLKWLKDSKGQDIVPPDESDVYVLAQSAGLRTQTLTALPGELAESILFGAEKGAFTGAIKTRVGIFQADEPVDIFLDEIGDASSGVQAKLLEVLETKTYRPLGLSFDKNSKYTDVRVIAATNRDLPSFVEKGMFRSDLYDRLCWATIILPPLRDQLDQLTIFIRRMLSSLRRKYDLPEFELDAAEMNHCKTYNWPGNHRQLYQVLWEWCLYEGKTSLRDIIERRSTNYAPSKGLEEFIVEKLFARFDAIRAGVMPGFQTYGELPEELRKSSYKAIYLYNRQYNLKDHDLRLIFTKQDPTNIRKQISQNRPPEEIR